MKSEPKSSTTPSETKNGGGTSLSGETPKATPTTLAAKLLNIQKEVEAVTKDSVNPHFKNSYPSINAILETIKPILNEYRVILLQPLTHLEGVPAIRTMLIDVDSPATIEATIPLPPVTDPQKFGSAVTYYRRYTLLSLFSLQAEDDDGNAASGKTFSNSSDDIL